MEDKISWFLDVFSGLSRLVRLHFPTTFWDNANLGAPDSINSINILHFGANLIASFPIFLRSMVSFSSHLRCFQPQSCPQPPSAPTTIPKDPAAAAAAVMAEASAIAVMPGGT